MRIEELYKQLASLERQKAEIEKQIALLKKEIQKHSVLSKADKIALFRRLFIGNEQVFARYWVSKDGLKKGYSPVTKTFGGSDYIPVSDYVIEQHLKGKIRIGTYAVKNLTMCSFLVIDLDKSSFVTDARAIKNVCKELEVYPYFELSKSGEGIHVWFFFLQDVKAKDARLLGDLILSRAMDIGDGIDMRSYDRLFPNQDFVAPDALGSLIALPLHYESRKEGKTVFIDIDTMQPFKDQWELLQNVVKISVQKLQNIIADYVKSTENSSLMPWEVKQEKLLFPKSLKIVLYDAVYIEKLQLSKSFLNLLKRMASFYNPEFFMRQKQRLSTYNIPRVVSAFDINERYIILPRGLYRKLTQFCKENRVHVSTKDKRLLDEIDSLKFNLKLRKEQSLMLDEILNNDYSLLVAPPGFGKTAVAAAVIAKRLVKTLVLVHKTALLEQWAQRLSDYFKIDIASIGILGKAVL